ELLAVFDHVIHGCLDFVFATGSAQTHGGHAVKTVNGMGVESFNAPSAQTCTPVGNVTQFGRTSHTGTVANITGRLKHFLSGTRTTGSGSNGSSGTGFTRHAHTAYGSDALFQLSGQSGLLADCAAG